MKKEPIERAILRIDLIPLRQRADNLPRRAQDRNQRFNIDTAARINAQAGIIFDNTATIEQPQIVTTLDASEEGNINKTLQLSPPRYL